MTKYEKYIPHFICLIFFIISLGHINSNVLGDEVIYLFPGIGEISYFDFIPGVANKDFFYGHPSGYPLLLRILSDISGGSIFVLKTFSLLISVLFLFTLIYLLPRKNRTLLGSLLIISLALNQLFITHSSMLYPDILFSFLGVLSWHFYRKENLGMFIVCGFLCLLVRESGLAFIAPVAIHSLLKFNKELFQRRVFISCLGLFFLLCLFFAVHFYSYGSFFGNEELLKRSGDGFSFFAINYEKIKSLSLNAFVIKSFGTTIPFSVLIFYYFLFGRLKKAELSQRNVILWSTFIIGIVYVLIVVLSSYEVAIRYQHILVNLSIFAKLSPSLFIIWLATNSDSMGERKNQNLNFAVMASVLILTFYFFYQDSSPRNLLNIISLYLTSFYIIQSQLNLSKVKVLFISFYLIMFQSLWFKVPQVPHVYTHPKIQNELTQTIKAVVKKINQQGIMTVYSSGEFFTLIGTPLYGWGLNEDIAYVENINNADLVISTNYYPRASKSDLADNPNYELIKQYKLKDVFFDLYLKRPNNLNN